MFVENSDALCLAWDPHLKSSEWHFSVKICRFSSYPDLTRCGVLLSIQGTCSGCGGYQLKKINIKI